ncbi:hypothetical protein G7051_03095 [Dysgonomonas sp. HDW5B]|uniref:hypothetical protein n=1 Tax=Dysgonomonas sp. HDW5B TaxID=2714927 RepID=UPI00140A3CB7|nr:hypothetical protein [Dysgonomonas sp. HDW5B]QIK53388.1 hypothetical protein G7051_03095 [Dysgonomonas sp. HDW5B]
MEKMWINNIYNTIKYYSDMNILSDAWLGSNKESSSCFDEDVSLLFDSFCFDDFINEVRNKDISKDLLWYLIEFRNMLDSYNKPESNLPLDILNDPKWLEIVNKAKEVIEHWDIPNL